MSRYSVITAQITHLEELLMQVAYSEPKRDSIESDLYALWEERIKIEDRNYCVFCCMHHMPEEGCVHHAIDGAIG